MVPSAEPVILPEQVRLPFELVTVHPVAADPPASSTFPVEVFPIWTRPVEPASRVRFEVPPAVIAPAAAKSRAVAETPIVSMEATPVRAPPVVTFKPPFEEIARVPVALPRVTFPVPVPSETFPDPFTVKEPPEHLQMYWKYLIQRQLRYAKLTLMLQEL